MDSGKSIKSMARKRAKMRYYRSVLSSNQLDLLKLLGPFLSEQGLYLAGGTAIALMLGHRRSIDLDWFSPINTSNPRLWVKKIKSVSLTPKNIDVDEGTFYATINGVRTSIIDYEYPMLKPLVKWEAMNCSLCSLDDLSCMKLSAITSRGSKKDFVDVYALKMKHKTLNALIKLYQKKYPDFDLFPAFRGLGYFDDADKEPMPEMIWKVSWQEIKNEIEKDLKQIIR